MSAPLVSVLDDVERVAAMAGEWSSLLVRSGTDGIANSPTWQLAWWRVFGGSAGRALRVVTIRDEGRLVGLAPLLSRPDRHRPWIPFRRLELLATGEDEVDEIGSDYLGILAERGAELLVATAFADALEAGALGPWDELSLRSMSAETAVPKLLADALAARRFWVETELASASFFIPLPSTWDAYLAALSPSRRHFVRRSLKDFHAWAGHDKKPFVARTASELEVGMQVLRHLHRLRWAEDGKEGAFASPLFRAFHDDVMPQLLEQNALELTWLEARGEPVAAAYNLVWRSKVNFYQSGRAMNLPKGVRPGIALHAHAIRAAIEAGLGEYDFLPGSARYKMELSLGARSLIGLRAARVSAVEIAHRTAELAIDEARFVRDTLRARVSTKST